MLTILFNYARRLLLISFNFTTLILAVRDRAWFGCVNKMDITFSLATNSELIVVAQRRSAPDPFLNASVRVIFLSRVRQDSLLLQVWLRANVYLFYLLQGLIFVFIYLVLA